MDEDTAAQEVLDTILAGERLKAEEQFGALGNTAGATTTGPARVAMTADGPAAPSNGPGAGGEGDPGVDDLEARLAALRKP